MAIFLLIFLIVKTKVRAIVALVIAASVSGLIGGMMPSDVIGRSHRAGGGGLGYSGDPDPLRDRVAGASDPRFGDSGDDHRHVELGAGPAMTPDVLAMLLIFNALFG